MTPNDAMVGAHAVLGDRWGRLMRAALPPLLVLACAACGDTEPEQAVVPVTPPVTPPVMPPACSDASAQPSPVRILFVMDNSAAMAISDPPAQSCAETPCLTRRGQAVLDVLTEYPPGDGVAYGLITFDSAASILTTGPDGMSGFTTSKAQVLGELAALADSHGQASYDAALESAFEMLQEDMLALSLTVRSSARYEIVFMSGDTPNPFNVGPGETVPPVLRTDVLNIASLETTQEVAIVAFNTVYINAAGTPVNVEYEVSTLLSTMAMLGRGAFSQVDSNESINLSGIEFTSPPASCSGDAGH